MFPHGRIFVRQTWALTRKNLLIAVVRHWASTLFRAVILPIAFMALLANIKNFLIASNGYGVGSPSPIASLAESVPTEQKLVFVQPPGLGQDVAKVVQKLSAPLVNKTLVLLTDPNDLITTCKESLTGFSDCYAAIVFNDSPLTTGKRGIWNYTIRTDSGLDGSTWYSNSHSNDQERVNLPWQLAIDNAISNSTIVPQEYLYSSISQATHDDNVRKKYQDLIISTYGIAFFIAMVSSIYHLVGMMTTERESGMTALIDAMGGSAAVRICSYIFAFDIIYFPTWIVIGIIFQTVVFKTTSIAILIFWEVFTGMAITSASIFAAMFFNRAQLSGVYSTLGFLIIGVVGQIIGHGSVSTGVVAILSLLFPSMNYMFMIGNMGRFERQDLPTNILQSPAASPDTPNTFFLPSITLWAFLWIQIVVYPILALYTERWIHGTNSRGRSVGLDALDNSSAGMVELLGLTKVYPPTFRQKWLTRGKVGDIVAVNNLDLVAQKGQILCLLGANGSGKTTTLDMIGGLQTLSTGSIRVRAGPSQLGICPQRNILWDDLTVKEHIDIWNKIKHSQDDVTGLDSLIEACDLTTKKYAKGGTLSGGQKRKLQLACMFVGRSTVCLLDEVSSGLDPLSRRIIWNIILAERSKRTMILTTHFLDEADVLADHIAIISLGLLKCEGSAVELKTQLGGGYMVHVPGTVERPQAGFLAKRLEDQTVYNTPDSATAAELITTLESQGHTGIYVNGPTVEDVFLRVNSNTENPIEDRTVPVHSMTDNISIDDTLDPSRATTAIDPEMKLSSGRDISFLRQTLVLFRKRYTVLLRNWVPYAIAFILPVAVTPALQSFLNSYVAPLCSGVTFVSFEQAQPLNIFFADENIGNLQLLIAPPTINQTLYSVLSKFPIGFGLNMSNYTNQFLFEDSFASLQNHVSALYSNVTPGALYMGDAATPATYAAVADFGILPAMLMQNLWTQLHTGIPVAAYYTPFDSLVPNGAANSIQWIAYFCLMQAVYPAFFTLYPTLEKLRNVRALQYSNGVRVTPMWFSYMLFDFMFVIVTSAVCTIVISQQASWWFGVAYMFPVLALYGLASILLVYVISIFASSQLGAFAFAAGMQAVMFLVALIAFVITETFSSPATVQNTVDAITFGINLFFPVANVVRSAIVGFNLYLVNCRNDQYISSPGSIYAYGGPILYLCIQVAVLFWLTTSLEGARLPRWIRHKQTAKDTEHELHSIGQDVENEKNRVDGSTSDLLRVLRLTKSFGSNVAVDDVSFGVGPGEVFALLGPNGAGKSTTINMIRGEMRPDSGSVLLEGTNIDKHMRVARKYLGVCPQFDALDVMTTKEHLEFYARAKGITTVKQDVDNVMRKVGLEAYGGRLAAKLSGGNKRKLSLAIALIGNPTVLVLDEPSSSMDAASKRVMWKTLMEVTAGRSLLLTTHSMEEADALATRAAIISKRILTIGTTAFLREKHGNVYHIHLVLKSAPTSTREEMDAVEAWADQSLTGVCFDSFGSHHGQIRFSVPVTSSKVRIEDLHIESEAQNGDNNIGNQDTKQQGGVGMVFSLLEANKEAIGLKFYSVGATTLDQVFLKVVTLHNVAEEDGAGL